MATIDDVAKLAGVSKGTVSSVFSKKRPISQPVTDRVLSVAKELGYFPNHIARSLAIKKTMIVGLKMPISKEGSTTQFEIQMLNGVIKECTKHGYRILLDTLPEHEDLTQFSSDPVDGVIMLNPRKHDQRIERFEQMRIPLVLVGRPDPLESSISYVDNDNEQLAYEVGSYLLEQGHRSILFLNASANMTVSVDRVNGLKKAYEEQGIPYDNVHVMNFDRQQHATPMDYGYMSIMQMHEQVPFTAVVSDTDRVALGILRATRELGIHVPRDLSIVALSNDVRLAEEMSPKLTSVELSAETLGAEAGRILIQKMKDPSTVEQLIVDAQLIVRESTRSL
ncbi:LacI family DNA-binding transcriptional regulator [Paenibacillus sp. CGMCC 1.16610]|uniref:LacI family DNA-binding transcriptional regulator n=1 Tax=Paenibacillus anseongense TaxID=2682845 RepID=A0ABW9UQW0_9BACL|nr:MULTISPECIES: LacI family DNA-binding transcriptional regulator [Paenibacillus]MBA2941488.1 LacI family DNA-binding transcriptional regulator [Paenibacillus sp. CGMCC 1.16610]MVQ40305.1 LacI family DNA-binding transcriptional regulator [Paenibacillus anseongense]